MVGPWIQYSGPNSSDIDMWDGGRSVRSDGEEDTESRTTIALYRFLTDEK